VVKECGNVLAFITVVGYDLFIEQQGRTKQEKLK